MTKEIKMTEKKPTVILKNLIMVFVLLALFTPLIFDLKSFFPFNYPRALFFMAMVHLAFFTWIILAINNRNYRPQKNILLITVSLFILVLIINTIFSYDPSMSFWSNQERTSGLLMHLHLFALFLVCLTTFKDKKDWSLVFGFSVLIASVVSVIGIIDNNTAINFHEGFRSGSTLGNTSFMGTYLLLSFFPALYFSLKQENKIRIFYFVNTILIASGIILNPGGRAMKGALLAGIFLMIILYLAFVNRNKIVRLISKLFLASASLVLLVFGFMTFQEGSFIREKVFNLHGMPGRLTVWDSAWQGFLERPILGWGMESFNVVFFKNFNPKMYLPEYGVEVWFDKAHNIIFESLATTGLVGTIMLFSVFIVAVFVLWKRYLKEKKIDFVAPIIFTALFVAYFIQVLTVFDMVSSYMVLFLVLAFIAYLCHDEKQLIQEKRFNVISLLILFPLLLSFFFFVLEPQRGNTLFAIANLTEISEEKIDYYQKSIDASPLGRKKIIDHLANNFYKNYQAELKVLQDKIDSAETLNERAKYQKKIIEKKQSIEKMFLFIDNEFKKIIQNKPNFRDYWLIAKAYNNYFETRYLDILFESYLNNNQENDKQVFDEAFQYVNQTQEYIDQAINYSPENIQIYWELSQAKINKGKLYALLNDGEKAEEKFQESLTIIEQAIKIEPLYVGSHVKAVEIAKGLLNDSDLADKKMQEALKINSSWQEHFNDE